MLCSGYSRMRDVISNKEHEVVSLRRQLDGTTEELTEVGRAREVALRENRRLQDDLSTMTRENQVQLSLSRRTANHVATTLS